jgi:flagellar biosynthesis protein FlhG
MGYILRDESLRAAVTLQSPVALFPDTDPSARSFIRLADALDSATKVGASEHAFSSYWQQQYRQGHEQKHEQEQEQEQEQTPGLEQEPAPQPALPTAQERDEDYVSELRSRLLPLIEQGHSDVKQVATMLHEAVSVFLSRHGQLPVNIISLLEQSILSPERDDQLMRDIFDVVKPWGVANTALANDLYMPASEENIEPRDPLEGAELDATECDDGKETSATEESNHCGHLYDAKRFGSQQHLLDLLMRRGEDDQPLLKLIDKLG